MSYPNFLGWQRGSIIITIHIDFRRIMSYFFSLFCVCVCVKLELKKKPQQQQRKYEPYKNTNNIQNMDGIDPILCVYRMRRCCSHDDRSPNPKKIAAIDVGTTTYVQGRKVRI